MCHCRLIFAMLRCKRISGDLDRTPQPGYESNRMPAKANSQTMHHLIVLKADASLNFG